MSILHCLIQVYNTSHNTSSIQVYNTVDTLIDVTYSRRSIIVRLLVKKLGFESVWFPETIDPENQGFP